MSKEITRFHNDATENRHSPYPIPSSSEPPPSSPPQPEQLEYRCECIRIKTGKLLRAREISGNMISSGRSKRSFEAEYRKSHAMKPTIWNYNETKNKANVSLEHAFAKVQLACGLVDSEILLTGGEKDRVQIFRVGEDEHGTTPKTYEAECILPHNMPRSKELVQQQLGSSYGDMFTSTSDVSCVKLLSSRGANDCESKHVVVTTLGSEDANAYVILIDISKPLDFGALPVVDLYGGAISLVAAYKKAIWTADCDPNGRRVVIGTSTGAGVISTEHRAHSWLFRCASDVLSVEFDQSGNNVLSGMRNGAVVNIDSRQKPIKWTGPNSSSISLNSSICCLRSLKFMDQYFLASSMDGSIKLYDQRLIQKGPVQSYQGNANSHSRIELGVDPSEKTVISGGEDCYLRLWDIKSGGMLFEEKFMNSIASAVCWPRRRSCTCCSCWHGGVWLGSDEAICYMDWL